MLLGGLWHGASLSFVAGGGLHGLGLVAERFFWQVVPIRSTWLSRLQGWWLPFHFVCFCWVFFRAGSFLVALQLLHQITHNLRPDLLPVLGSFRPVFVLMALGYLLYFLPDEIAVRLEKTIAHRSVLTQAALLALVI